MAAWHEFRAVGRTRRARRRYTMLGRIIGTVYGLAVLGLAVLFAYKVAR